MSRTGYIVRNAGNHSTGYTFPLYIRSPTKSKYHMSTATNTQSIDTFLERLQSRTPHETEFHQAVREFSETILPYIESKEQYLGHALMERLTEPERIITFRVTWMDDEGDIQVNRGYRVEFNGAIGPYKGGLRFHPTVNLSILKFLGFEQIFKNSLTNLPMGGGKGGSDFNPKGRSEAEIMRFCQAFMMELFRHIGPDTDVPAGDIGVGGREIGYMYGMYKKLANENTGVLTGKGLSYGGSNMRTEATGYGLIYFVNEMLRRVGEQIDGKKVIVSGSGNVALHAVEKALQMGATVHAVSDSSGTVYDKDGINEEKLAYIKELKEVRRGRIKEYAEAYDLIYMEGKTPWELPCDIALPCATQNELQADAAEKLIQNGCRVVAEGANMPTTNDAIALLQQSDVLYAPGKATNAGGVATSGLEMSQNSLKTSWSSYEVDCKLREIMQDIHSRCVEYGEDSGQIDYVRGANIAGFIKVADAMIAQGIV